MNTKKIHISFFSLLFFFLFSALLCSCNPEDEIIDEPIIEEPNDSDSIALEPWPFPKLISLWNHQVNLNISNVVNHLGINLVWPNDPAYSGQSWEQSHMFQSLQFEGVDYVFGKINRAAWGWTHLQSIEHARWVAMLSLVHPEIIGLYLNDFYDEIEEGYRTETQWRQIIAAAKNINPDLHIWVPHYPHRNQGKHDFNFDIDGVIVNIWGNRPEQIEILEEHIASGLEHHPNRYVIAGLYLHSGIVDGGRWLTEEEFKKILGHYVDLMNENKLVGVRLFSAEQFVERPEYIEWAKEVLERLETNSQSNVF